MRNQWVMEYHSIVAKLKQDSAGAEDHRNTLATAKRSRRGRCRPRGRRERTVSSRRIQVTKVGWLGAQGIGEAWTGFAETATALVRRQKLDGAAAAVTGKQRRRENEERRRWLAYNTTRKRKEATRKPSPCQRDAQTVTRATGSKPKLAGGVAQAVNTVHSIYKFAIRQNSQITLKFS